MRSASVTISALLLLSACGGGGTATGTPSPSGSPGSLFGGHASRRPVASAAPSAAPSSSAAFPAYAATARGKEVAVYDKPGGAVLRRLASPLPSGATLTFLVVTQRPGWVQAYLPVRPNGSTGWLRAQDVTLAGVPYRVDVHLGRHELELYDQGKLVRTLPIGVGKTATPTPGGTYYLKELLRPPNPSGAYGPYAYGLSGFSTTLRSFAGADAVIGLHGTDDPSSIGRDVSHGCIRLRNADITALAKLLPLGTPVRILAS